MTGAFIILAVTAAIGIVLWAWERWRSQHHGNTLHHHASASQKDSGSEVSNEKESPDSSAICCGLHTICEKTGRINDPPVYYDDEELDRFARRPAEEYNEEEIEEFRDVMLTLLPQDLPGWIVSIEKRNINLPSALQPELELLLAEMNGL